MTMSSRTRPAAAADSEPLDEYELKGITMRSSLVP